MIEIVKASQDLGWLNIQHSHDVDRWWVDGGNGMMAAHNTVWKVSPGCDCSIDNSPTRLQLDLLVYFTLTTLHSHFLFSYSFLDQVFHFHMPLVYFWGDTVFLCG